MLVNATYVSVWDGGVKIRTQCMFDMYRKIVSDVDTVDVDGLDVCEEEYIELSNGVVYKEFIREEDLDGVEE